MTDVQTPKKERAEVSTKEYIDASGGIVEIEAATGLRYTSLPDGTIRDILIPGAIPGEPKTMLAAFGMSTLATNTASQNRNRGNEEDKFPTDAEAVADRFARIEQDVWGIKAGGGVGINIDVLYLAVVEANGGAIPASGEVAWKEKRKADAETRKSARNHTLVAPIYERMMRERRPVTDEKPIGALLD